MKKKLPSSQKIDNSAKAIRRRELTHIASFADVTNRYIDIIMKRDTDSRLNWGVLSYLIIKGGSLRPTELAKLMFRSKHSMTLAIDELEKQGFVVRQHTSKDRRRINVKITQDGIEYFMNMIKRADNKWAPALSCLSDDERIVFVELMRRMRKIMIEYITEKIG